MLKIPLTIYNLMCSCYQPFHIRYELWKPNLRAIMEHDMNEVSVGNKTKAEVLETCLQQMKACFLDVSELYHIYYFVFSLWLNLFSAEAVANAMG